MAAFAGSACCRWREFKVYPAQIDKERALLIRHGMCKAFYSFCLADCRPNARRTGLLERCLRRLEYEKAREAEAQAAADQAEAERLAMQAIDWCAPHLCVDHNTLFKHVMCALRGFAVAEQWCCRGRWRVESAPRCCSVCGVVCQKT